MLLARFSGMASILIAYATGLGQTEKIARRIADVLRQRGDAVNLFNTDAPGPDVAVDRFDAVVVAAPIHAGGYPKSIVRFAKANARALEHVRSAFCSVGLAVASRTSDGRAQTMRVVDEFVKRTNWHPAHVELVAGALPYSRYNFIIRFVMRRIARHEGGDTDTSRDYEYTDWAALDRFASELSADAAVQVKATA